VVSRRARLHADKTGRQIAKKLEHLLETQLPCENGFFGCIDAVDLEDILGKVDGANLHVDDPLR
jgi:hypothetical protein